VPQCRRCLTPSHSLPHLAAAHWARRRPIPPVSHAHPRRRALPSSPVAAAPTAPVRRAPLAVVRAAQSQCVRAMLVHIAEPRPPSLPCFLLHTAPHPGPLPLPCLPRLRFKMSLPPHRTLFSPPRSPPLMATRASHAPLLFPPLVHAGD
jgi:hypothetical protein